MAGGRQLGSYRLVAPLATGGMAELFVAKTGGVSGFEKQVALKVIHPNFSSDPDFVRMLVDEAKLTVQLQHANIVQTYDLGQVGGQYYIAMELIDGADLYKVLKNGSERGLQFPIDVATFITSEVAGGLDYAHRKKDPLGRPLQIVHRDVSPQNVLISFEGAVKIVDFGIAKAALRDQQTRAGVIKGKYYYMSPEQAWGDKIDARTDVFSTGILLHEMLVGEMLYLEEDLDRLLTLVRAADIQAPSRKRPEVPPELDAIVMKALSKRPADRYQSAADLSNALARFLRTQFPDFGPARVARYVREALQREGSRADITPPPPRPEEFGDENSLIFDMKGQQRIAAADAHHADPDDTRRGDQQTRGISLPSVDSSRRPETAADFEDAGATEFDPKPMVLRDAVTAPDSIARKVGPAVRERAPGFLDMGTDGGEQTELQIHRRGAPPRDDPGFADVSEDESTRLRASSPPAERARRASLPPSGPGGAPLGARRGALPPIAQPPVAPRAAMGLGVRSREPRGDAAAPSRAPGQLAVVPAPAPHTGASPIDADWNTAPTETPAGVAPWVRSDFNPSNPPRPSSAMVRRKKLLFAAGMLLIVATGVLGIALIWPEGPPRGSIEVVSSPAGATVRIDGTVLSKLTPIRISDVELHLTHRIAVSLRGYDTWESDARFDTGEHGLRLQAVLVPAVGTLQVETTPPGAEVIVNDRNAGNSPVRVGDLPPNEDVTVELRLRGYRVASRTLSWNGKRTLSLSVPLEKAH